ncbi:DUF1523 family protein [Helicobacter cetorum]|uniref:DUF1523 family protein n=1 Tax=Helicobacter cetorum TaxID=138563 RepID=UPI000CF07DAD|nr:DUF1523 family protein [Helicobacter cetorum]
MKIVRNIVLSFLTMIFLALMLCVSYFMPHYKAVFISGIEVKRMDKNGLVNKSHLPKGPTRDVYFIQTYNPNDKKDVIVFRNEDTRFGFPFYFKFNSADISALAQSLVNQRVEVKYYGWRINLFDMFANAISIKPLEENSEVSKPIFSWILYVLLLGGLFISAHSVRKWFNDKIH